MNEHGLVIAMAAVPESIAGVDPAKPTMGSLRIIREVLDHALNVEQAVKIFSQYNIDFSGGPPIHYLLADASGQAVLLEFVQGEMVGLPNENPWHLATNHLRTDAVGDGGCSRYRLLEERLRETQGQIDAPTAMNLLQAVSQRGSTQWSVVYNISSREINIALGGNYKAIHTFQLNNPIP